MDRVRGFAAAEVRKLTVEVRHLASLPPLRHLLQLGALPPHDVRELGAKRRACDVERSGSDGLGTSRRDQVEGVSALILREGDEEAATVGEKKLRYRR